MSQSITFLHKKYSTKTWRLDGKVKKKGKLYIFRICHYKKKKKDGEAKVLEPKAAGKRQRFDDRDDLQTLDPEVFGLPATWTVVGAPRLSGPFKGQLDKYYSSPNGFKTPILGRARAHARIFGS